VLLWNLDDEIGGADVPLFIVHETPWRRHVGRIASGRASVHPGANCRDFLVRQRRIVLELGDSNISLDVPRRHLAIGRSGLDCANPWPHILVCHERHRALRARMMAILAGTLKNGSHVPGKRDFLLHDRCGRLSESHRSDQSESGRTDYEVFPHGLHIGLPFTFSEVQPFVRQTI
jgi:hypothetical protein